MALTKSARSKILALVQDAKRLLMKEVEEQLQQYYGVRPDGTVLMIEQLTTNDSDFIYTARVLRQRLDYIKTNLADKKNEDVETVRQLVREQAFTILNRFASLRMAEERGIIKETVRKEYNSEGFQVFDSITGQGQTAPQYIRYKWYIHAIFDELALDLPSVFDRFSPYALIFPSEQAMNRLLDIINREEITIHREEGLQSVNLWKEDETIGWIYQYYNSREEISAMRDASDAPRNSQELAVRNQFFTPRYVVQFLTDNSLGRIWYEMTEGNTVLKSLCSYLIVRPREVFLRKGESKPEISDENTVYVEYHAIKDPREILMLDPACGSMHFGLYCFDLFEHIYTEAWDNYPELLTDIRNSMTKSEFVKQIPELIIRHNIHGVDIDPRALQIAGLSLWLRAQKSFDKQNLNANQRPQITRSNLVLAEPMPGSIETLSQLVQPLDAPMRNLVLAIWDKMMLAGETGLLLRIEEEIDKTISEIVKELADGKMSSQLSIGADDSELKAAEKAALYATKQYRERFLNSAETEVLKMLKQLAETATDGDAYQKLLFADDTARGFALIELCRKKYDVVLMNPPFGASTIGTKSYIATNYPLTKFDIYASFIDRGLEFLQFNGSLGIITSKTGFYINGAKKWRKRMIEENLNNYVDLGIGVLDALVEVSCYSVKKNSSLQNISFLDFRNTANKEELFKDYFGRGNSNYLFEIDRSLFRIFDDYSLSYWIPKDFLEVFKSYQKLVNHDFEAQAGLSTKDDFRFLRLIWEINLEKSHFKPIAKGGEYAKYWSEIHLAIDWKNNGHQLHEYQSAKYPYLNGNTDWLLHPESKYFSPALTYTRRSSKGFSVRFLPKGCMFSDMGRAIIHKSDNINSLVYLLGILNSNAFSEIIKFKGMTIYEGGVINNCPIPTNISSLEISNKIIELTKVATQISFHFSSDNEASNYFTGPIMVRYKHKELNQIYADYMEIFTAYINEYKRVQFHLNELSNKSYKVTASTDVEDLYQLKDLETLVNDFLLFIFGVLIGRFETDKLDVLNYELDFNDSFPNNSRLINLNYHTKHIVVCDLTAQSILERDLDLINKEIFGDFGEHIFIQCIDYLGYKSAHDFYSSTNFFNKILDKYSESRRIAPIYWPISTPSGSYTVWLYYPKLTDQTLVAVINNHLQPKIDDLKNQIKPLEINSNLDNKGLKELAILKEFEHEMEEMKKELLRITTLPFKPNHDDGVLITAAPLHTLIHHAKWRNSTEDCWKALKNGEYDWAHLAYSIWPERVTQKCKKDLSMAIAHGLEEICEVKPKEKREKKVAKSANKNMQAKLID